MAFKSQELKKISIHSPYTGRDSYTSINDAEELKFQSTLPIQGETWRRRIKERNVYISIHSPYTGRDADESFDAQTSDISIHSPYTGRDDTITIKEYMITISIHSPYTGRDGRDLIDSALEMISIHSPYTGRDKESYLLYPFLKHFNPLSLYRERLYRGSIL